MPSVPPPKAHGSGALKYMHSGVQPSALIPPPPAHPYQSSSPLGLVRPPKLGRPTEMLFFACLWFCSEPELATPLGVRFVAESRKDLSKFHFRMLAPHMPLHPFRHQSHLPTLSRLDPGSTDSPRKGWIVTLPGFVVYMVCLGSLDLPCSLKAIMDDT